MRELLIRFTIIFSVFMAGMHFPAEAAQSRVQGDVEAYTCIEEGGADTAEQHSLQPDDQAGETAHHHHNPMALDLFRKTEAGNQAHTPSLHFPVNPAALSSRNPVPPLDPPLA